MKKLFCFFSEDSFDPQDDLEDEGLGGKCKSLQSGIIKEETQR